jgi:hypothetical protein
MAGLQHLGAGNRVFLTILMPMAQCDATWNGQLNERDPFVTYLFTTTIAAVFTASIAMAQAPGIQNHDVQILFMQRPCAQAVATIDVPPIGLEGIGRMAMAFGFLMGFEVAHPGIRGEYETILMRLRADCAAHGDKTAIELLRGYVQE